MQKGNTFRSIQYSDFHKIQIGKENDNFGLPQRLKLRAKNHRISVKRNQKNAWANIL